jgi:hypothetical protein
MLVKFRVGNNLPPKKDGANSMWRKPSEVPRLKALRLAAAGAMQGAIWDSTPISLRLSVSASIHQGDLDNFITGVCDGLMGAHGNTPIDVNDWQDVPELVRPRHAIAFRDDRWIMKIVAERIESDGGKPFYEVEIEQLDR